MGKPKAEFLGRHLLNLEASRQEWGWDCQVDQEREAKEGSREVTSQSPTTHHRLGKLSSRAKSRPSLGSTILEKFFEFRKTSDDPTYCSWKGPHNDVAQIQVGVQ